MEAMRVEITPGRNGEPSAKLVRGTKSVTLHSLSPWQEAERLAEKISPAIETVVVAGFGMGYLAEYLLQQTSHRVLVYDHEPSVIEAAKVARNLNSVLSSPRIAVVTGEPQELTRYLAENDVRELSFSIHRAYHSLYPEIYGNLEGLLAAHLAKRQINRATLKRFQKTWLKNIVKNAPAYFTFPGMGDIRHPFSGKPAVVVGAGPSLGRNIGVLKDVQDRACVIATDTALPMLCENGVKADFVVSVDPQDRNTLFLLYSRCRDAVLVLEGAGSFVSLAKYNPERTVLAGSIFPLYEALSVLWGDRGSLRSGGSVSTTAFDLARQLGCSPIVMVGQDLAYTGRATHFRGNVLEDFLYWRIDRLRTWESYSAKTLVQADSIEIAAWDGGKVRTDRKFLTFLDWFIREIRETNVPVINATEGGAHIEGAAHERLADCAAGGFPQPFDKAVRLERRAVDESAYRATIKQVLRTVESLQPLCRKALAASGRASAAFARRQDLHPLFREMGAFDRALLVAIREGTPVGRFLELAMQDSIDAIMRQVESPAVDEALLSSWSELYREALEALARVRHLLRKA
jgi:hypothetical protein